jgi:hypothetical protein
MEVECISYSEDIIRKPRGRPPKLIDISNKIIDHNIKRASRGRPKKEFPRDIEEIKSYQKSYYQNNKNKECYLRQKDDYYCEVCELVVMYCNRSRHNKSQYHLQNEDKKVNECIELINEKLINKMSDEFCKLFYN